MLATDHSTKIIEKNEEEDMEDETFKSGPLGTVNQTTQNFSFSKEKSESPIKVIVDEGQDFEINNLGLIDKEMTDQLFSKRAQNDKDYEPPKEIKQQEDQKSEEIQKQDIKRISSTSHNKSRLQRKNFQTKIKEFHLTSQNMGIKVRSTDKHIMQSQQSPRVNHLRKSQQSPLANQGKKVSIFERNQQNAQADKFKDRITEGIKASQASVDIQAANSLFKHRFTKENSNSVDMAFVDAPLVKKPIDEN